MYKGKADEERRKMELKSIEEIERMLEWLDGEISEHEIRISKPYGWFGPSGRELFARTQYAGCLAERAFLLDLENRVLCRERRLDDSGS